MDQGDEARAIGALRSNPLLVFGLTLAYYALSILSRRIYPLFGLVVLIGIGAPLALGGVWRDLRRLACVGGDVRKVLAWGLGAGVVSTLIGLPLLGDLAVPDNLGQQLLIGAPMWLLVISPFQELFFRGMLQSALTEELGEWMGLLIATVCFTAWHYLSPIVDLTSFPLMSWAGLVSTFAAGAAYGYAHQRSKNVIAPWLAHAISGISFVVLGAMDMVQAL